MTSLRLIAALFTLGLAAGCNYNVEQRHFPTRGAARTAHEEGWLPDFLPPSAYDIHVWENGDSGSERGAARFDPSELDDLENRLRTWQRRAAAPPAVDFDWWPVDCRQSSLFAGASLDTYVAAAPISRAIGIRPDAGVICWWSTHA